MTDHQYKQLPQDIKEERDLIFKIIIVGDKGVGKTMLCNKMYMNNEESIEEEENVTNNSVNKASYYKKNIQMHWCNYQVDNIKTCLQFWDTMGDNSFDNISSLFYKTASCIFLMYSITE
ncbi:MAG: hypothetical protein MJ252_11225 [archaeon]|nr:hypothetical protein [archaeon]